MEPEIKKEFGPVVTGLFDLAGMVMAVLSLAPWILGFGIALFVLVKMVKVFWYA